MKVTRTFHPVGQGAFFTESFFDNMGQCCFNVVYDCGSLSKHHKVLLSKQIDNAFSDNDHPFVDFLFISHLDADHVNGIRYLIDGGYLNERSTIVLPLFKEYQLKLYEMIEKHEVISFFSFLGAQGFRRILFVPFILGEQTDRQRLNMEELSDNVGEEANVMGVQGLILKSNPIFTFKQIWEYVPFNLYDSTSKEFFDAIEASLIICPEDLDNIFDVFKKDKELKGEKFKEIKQIYNSIGNNEKRKSSKININSLIVVSQAVAEVQHNDFIRCLEYCACCHCYHVFLQKRPLFWKDRASCVYTGDLSLELDADFDQLEIKLRSCSNGCFNLLQIPHHGSKNNYNPRLTDGLSLACFTNFDTTKKIFDKNLLFDFAIYYKPLFLITEYLESRFVQEIKLE